MLCGWEAAAQSPEFRALWVDTFHAGIKNTSQINTLLTDVRAGNFNAVIPEVRKRGDAYYQSNFEPEATDMVGDSLAELISRAHNTNAGQQRIEVHAWIVTYNIWNNQTTAPSQPDHPYNLHRDWLTQNNTGAQWDGGNYAFDPGHPEVQRHTFNVAMDIISRYDVDGFNFDYIRYAGNTWGYNPVAVARFNRRFGRTGQPSPTDAAWMQFRRDQVTALVRKVYLSAIALKPHVKISADTITWAPGPTSDLAWTNSSAAYRNVLQDWRSWMQEGILDLNIPMTYFRETTHPTDYRNWANFARDRKFNRHCVIGPGIYLNSLSNSLVQMRYTRIPTANGNVAEGTCGYSYAVPVLPEAGTSRPTFLAALTQTNTSRLYESNPQPMHAARVPVPVMPWKAAPTRGHIKGFVYGGSTTNPLDGATVTVTGAVQRTTLTDATGFYGFVDLPPGNYGASSVAGLTSAHSNLVVSAGVVRTADLLLITNDTTPPIISNVTVTQRTQTSARINWATDEASTSIVDYGPNAGYGSSVTNNTMVTVHSIILSNLTPNFAYHFRVRSRDSLSNLATSANFTFMTEAAPPIITAHPQSQSVRAGADVVFSVTASGTPPLAYQWTFNGNVLTNAINSTLARADVTSADAGSYAVGVSNAQGSAMSSNATLTITVPSAPRIQQVSLAPDGQLQLLISSDAGFPVEVEASPDLLNWASVTRFVNTNGTTTIIENAGQNRRFYRLRAE
jgi:uncharacterized lipoprotein YddW (UPF0748 family)